MKHPYTTVHDMRDIFAIYHDCMDYSMTFWNFTDQRHETLAPLGFWACARRKSKERRPTLMLLFGVVKPDSRIALKTVGDFKEYIDAQLELCSALDDAQVVVRAPGHDMKITFCGSSHPEKQVNYTIDYMDNHKAWKNKLNWAKINIKFAMTKLPLVGKWFGKHLKVGG